MTRTDVDVLVVGYGPVGAVAAALLGQAGLRVLVAERDPAAVSEPRAVTLDDAALRVLLGLPGCADLLEVLDTRQRAGFLDRHGTVLLEVDPQDGPLGLPGLSFFAQPDLERRVRAGVAGLPGVEVRLGSGLVSWSQDADGVTADVGGRPVRASWLLACDGATSGVRRSLGVPFRGRTARRSWLVVDGATQGPLPGLPYFSYRLDRERPGVDLPVPGGHRWEWALRPGETAESVTQPAALRELLSATVDPDLVQVTRAVVYTAQARRAARFRVGRVLLAGDAAHAMPPFAGQGLGTGIGDAVSVAWRLAEFQRGLAGVSSLDEYARERRAAAGRALVLAQLLGGLVSVDGVAADVRDRLLKLAAASPVLGGWLRAGGPRWPGAGLLPSPPVRSLAGRVGRLHAELGPGWALVGVNGPPLALASVPVRRWWAERNAALPLVVSAGYLRGQPLGTVEELEPGVARLWRRPEPGVLLVRPDRVVAAVCAAVDLPAATHRLATTLGAPAPVV